MLRKQKENHKMRILFLLLIRAPLAPIEMKTEQCNIIEIQFVQLCPLSALNLNFYLGVCLSKVLNMRGVECLSKGFLVFKYQFRIVYPI